MFLNSTKRINNFKKIWHKKNYIKKRKFQKFVKFKNKKFIRIYWWKPTLRKVQHSLKKILNILKNQKIFKINLKHLRYKKKKIKRRLKFHQWKKKKKKRRRRFIHFVKLRKYKRRKRFSEVLGFSQRNFIKNFFKVRLIPAYLGLRVERLVETNEEDQKNEMLDFLRKKNKGLIKKNKKRKLIKNVRWRIKRKKSRKLKKKSLRLKKKIKKLKKIFKKVVIFSKTSKCVGRLRFKRKYARLLKIKFKRKKRFILFLKPKKRRRRFSKKSSKRFFLRKRRVHRKRFRQKRIVKKKFNKKFFYKKSKWNKITTIRKEFMYLWKDKKKKRNKNFNLIFFKKIIKVRKKFKEKRTKSWKRRRLLFKIRNANERTIMKLFYRYTIKKKVKLRLKKLNKKFKKKIKLYNLKNRIKISIKKIKKSFSSLKKKKKKYFYAKWRKTKWKAIKKFTLLKGSIKLKKKKIKQKSIRTDSMGLRNKSELRLLLSFFKQRRLKVKKRRYNLFYKVKLHRKKKKRKIYVTKFLKKFKLIKFFTYARVKSIPRIEFFRKKKILIIQNKKRFAPVFFVIKFQKNLKKIKYKKIKYKKIKYQRKIREVLRNNYVCHKFKILFKKLKFSRNFFLKHKLKHSEFLKKIFFKKEKILFKAKYDHQRKKKKRDSWEKTKQRLRYERKIKYRRKRKYQKKLKAKKLLKIKNKVLEKDPAIHKKFNIKKLKKVFYKKAKIYFQRKKRHLKNSIFIRRKKKKRKLIFYIFKTKKWNIQLNNKTSRTFRNKRRTKKYGRQVKKNRIFFYVQNLNNGKIRRRRRNVFRLREALKKFIRKVTRGLPNNFKNYFSNPNKKEKNKSFEHFSNSFINNINIIIYRVGIFPSLSLSIEAVKQNWICRNFETPNIRENIMNIGDSITIAPSFNVYSNYLWTKRVYIEQMYTMDCSKQEFRFSKKPFLFIFVKIKQKNLVTNNAPKDWIKLSYLRNLRLIP